jgi:glycerol-3-phosphate dehydrogenase
MNGLRPTSLLSPERRQRDLAALGSGEVLDVLVVGGGITGVGVALDAAARGLRVGLVERGDLAAGTSRWSSKLVHGGLRYLANGQLAVAAESTRERGILATVVAPHLVRPLPFVTPLGDAGMGRAMGVAASTAQHGADALRRGARTPASLFPAPRRLGVEEALALAPGLARRGLRGALLNWDGQLEDDVRLVVAVARTAAAHGARIVTGVEVLDLGPGGATAVEVESGDKLDIRARHVVNATGVWASKLDPGVTLRPSRGSHLVLPAAALGNPRSAMVLPIPGHLGRIVLTIPQAEGTVLLGLTDEATDEIVDRAEPTPEEVDFLLNTISEGLERPVTRADVIGSYAGFRPLLGEPDEVDHPGERAHTADLSRRHAVIDNGAVITVTGGKLTTYRAMAADVVDRLTDVRCSTAQLPLIGAGVDDHSHPGLPPRLIRRFGDEAGLVADLAAGDPELLRPIADGVPALGVEVLWAVRAEGARTAEQVLEGRLRLDLTPRWLEASTGRVSELMSVESGTISA